VVSGSATVAGFLLHAALAGGFGAALGREGMGGGHAVPLAARMVYAVAVLAGLVTVAPKAWLALRRFRPDMNLLMTIAVFGALVNGEWFEAEAEGYAARAFLHETDHCDGKLFLDRLPKLRRDMVVKRFKKEKRWD